MLSRALPIGGAGCISATVNMNPAGIRAVYDGWDTRKATRCTRRPTSCGQIFQSAPMIPAMKHAVAEFASDPAWRAVRPPLSGLEPAAAETLMSALRAGGFAMPDYPAA